MSTTNKTVAIEILKQLGGNKFIAMAGAKNFGCSDNMMSFKIGRNSKGVSHVRITLNSMDLYDVEFLKCSMKTGEIKTVSEVNNIYNDMLQSTFTAQTGLYTSL